MEKDSICAVATAPGAGGIAIVRLSGSLARDIFARIFRPVSDKEAVNRTLRYGHAVDGNGESIDEVLAVFFAAPKTYTREDMFEIQCHGGDICAQAVMARACELGARAAMAGEFTRRAFLNGRIDLSRAEAVMSLIGAESELAARASLRQLEGGVSAFVRGVAEKIKAQMAAIEAAADFPDEVEDQQTAQEVLDHIKDIISELRARLDPRDARILQSGVSIVLTGRPNVGKSSLMNALLRADRAIVTGTPGTTRDVLTERIRLGGVMATLSDTAGRHETADAVEKIGVDRAARAAELADVPVIVLNGAEELTAEDRTLLENRSERSLVCVNKADLPQKFVLPGAVCVSAASGCGLDALKEELSRRVVPAALLPDSFIEKRHIRIVEEALSALNDAKAGIESGVALDLIEIDLRRALTCMGEITGEDAGEAVIDQVFACFCVGK